MRYDNFVKIKNREISIDAPTYFIADISANHDGDLERAKDLIWLAKEAGADAAKFQHFKADKIVSDHGFKSLGGQKSHQSLWGKSVFEVYRHYECGRTWTEDLVKTAQEAGIDFFTSPYDYEALELLDKYLPAYKIGSGDITWNDFIEKIASKGKPVFIATGASCMADVQNAVESILKHNRQIVLMQCNTNYTNSLENFKHINLHVLRAFALKYPNMVLGLSDHTPRHSTVLGAIALGARVIEKHLTDDNNRIGPDHLFSMNPKTWRDMVDRSRELENALGDGVKKVEGNEEQTVILQRRSIRLRRDICVGERITESDIEYLRPAPLGSLEPHKAKDILGRPLKLGKKSGEFLYPSDIGE